MKTKLFQKININKQDQLYIFTKGLKTHMNARKMENIFSDFDIDTFSFQAKEIYDDIVNAILYKEFPIIARSLHTDLFILNESIYKNIEQVNNLSLTFHKETSSWKIINLELDEDNALAVFKFTRKKDNQTSRIFFIREVSKNNFYLNWKIFHLI